MRDDRNRWTPSGKHDLPIHLPGVSVSSVDVVRQTLISGPRVLQQIKHTLIGWPDIAEQRSYAITLRRDRVLLINEASEPDGWNPDLNQAISDVSDAYSVFELQGDESLSLLNRGTELSLKIPSRSAARRLFGLDVILYRFTDANRYRLHVQSAQADALLDNINSVVVFLGPDE